MRIIKLDGRKMDTRQAAWGHMKDALGLPEYFGNNLDAFSDSLGAMRDVIIQFSYVNAALNALGSYGAGILQVLRDQADSRADFVLKTSAN